MIVEAVKSGELDESVLDRTVERLLTVIFKGFDNKKPGFTYDQEEHHKLARRTAAECMVLLKNEDNLLPLGPQQSVAVIGAFAKNPRYQGGGSSHIAPTRLDAAYDAIVEMAQGKVAYAEGYSLKGDAIHEKERSSQGSYGLRNVNNRLRLHYGREAVLRIESTEGRGTVVMFTIPIGEDRSGIE